MEPIPLIVYICVDNEIRSKHSLTVDGFTIEKADKQSNQEIGINLNCDRKNIDGKIQTDSAVYPKKCSSFQGNILCVEPIIDELKSSRCYRTLVHNNLKNKIEKRCELVGKPFFKDKLVIRVFSKDSYAIDYAWGWRLWRDCHLGVERECASAWLSTLGGAFSALGDYSTKCAEMALRTSLQQIRLASIADDPDGIARGWLFLALATSQLGDGPTARRLLRAAKATQSSDHRHQPMCLGVQAKIKYDSKMRRLARRENSSKRNGKKDIVKDFSALKL